MKLSTGRLVTLGLWMVMVAGESSATPPREAAGSPGDICPLSLGSTIPTLALKTARGEDYTLAPDHQAKPRILLFYRGGW